MRRAARTGARRLHDRRHRRRHRGDPRRRRLRKARPVRHQLRDEGRRAVRAGVPEPRRSAGARLGRAAERPRTARSPDVRGAAARAAPDLRRSRLRTHHREPVRGPHAARGAAGAVPLLGRCDRRSRQGAHDPHLLRRPAQILLAGDLDRRCAREFSRRSAPPRKATRRRSRDCSRSPEAAKERRESRETSTRRCTSRRPAKSRPSRGIAPPAQRAARRSERPRRALARERSRRSARAKRSNSATCPRARTGRSPRPRRRPSVAPSRRADADPQRRRRPAHADRQRPRSRRADPRPQLLVVPNTGHSVLADEPTNAAAKRCRRCSRPARSSRAGHAAAADSAPPPLPPRRLARRRARGGNRGLPGRTLHAVALTLRRLRPPAGAAALAQLAAGESRPRRCDRRPARRLGASSRDATISLHGYSYVPGVTVSGRSDRGGVEVLIGGRAAAARNPAARAPQDADGTLGGKRRRDG